MWRESWVSVPDTPTKERAALLGSTVMQGKPLLLRVSELPAAVVFVSSETSEPKETTPFVLNEGWHGNELLWALALLEQHCVKQVDYSQVIEVLIGGAKPVDFHGQRVLYRIATK